MSNVFVSEDNKKLRQKIILSSNLDKDFFTLFVFSDLCSAYVQIYSNFSLTNMQKLAYCMNELC